MLRHVCAVAGILAACSSLAGTRPASAQSVHLICGTDLVADTPQDGAPCTGTIVGTGEAQRFVLHLRLEDARKAGVAGAVVRLRATSGDIVSDSVVSTGPMGDIRAIWMRSGGADPVGIAVHATSPAGEASAYSDVRYIHLKPAEVTKRQLDYEIDQHFVGAAFEGATLSRPIVVELKERTSRGLEPIVEDSICRRQRVVFRGSGGVMSPDTAVPEVYAARPRGSNEEYKDGCRAQATWALGSGIGVREARFHIVPGKEFEVSSQSTPYRPEVRVRPLPRFVIGGVLQYDESYVGLRTPTKVHRVERPTANGGKVAYDSVGPGVPDTIRSTTGVLAGVVVPVPTRYTNWMTVLAGIDLTDPKRHQYLGLSVLRLLQLFRYDVPETLPLDLAVAAHFGTRPILMRPDDCRAGTSSVAGREACEIKEEWEPRGVAAVLSIDAGTILIEAIKKLGG